MEGNFNNIFIDNYGKVFSFMYNLTKDKQLSEDITQEAFINAFKRLSSFRGESKIHVWINRIAYNIFIDSKRKKAIKEMSNDNEIILNQIEDLHANFISVLEQKIMSECVRNKLDGLPENYRSALYLEMEGYSNKEIAKILHSTINNVKVLIHRGKNKLKLILDEECIIYKDENNALCCLQK
ncbi:MAG: RNA polymerase sigma factor [Treponema sp.]|nr:RNA polymerase sigma factor [Treponema sp.]